MVYLPQRKFLLLGFVLGLLLLVEFVNVQGYHPVTGLSEKALGSLCNSARIQSVFPPPKRLSDEDFDSGIYSAGSRDSWSDENEDSIHWSQEDDDTQWEYDKSARMINTDKLLKGNATSNFRDNLRLEYQYITGWGDGGFTNQFMGITNLLFLSLLTPHRIPLIPPFVSRPHFPVRAGYPAVSDIFDLDRWARAINKEVLEWKDVKDLRGLGGKRAPDSSIQADEQDELGCWSVWATANLEAKKPYTNSFVPDHLNLDISHTPVPREARLFPQGSDGDTHVSFNALAILSQATTANPNPLSSSPLDPPFPNFRNNRLHPPDSHLVCYDFLYRVSTTKSWEWEQEFSSAWNIVGKHAHWSDRIRSLARQTLAKTLGVVPREILPPVRGDSDFREDRDGRTYHPHDLAALLERDRVRIPYIAIHARHGDFLDYCQYLQGKEKGLACAPGLSEFERLIEEVEHELHRRGVGFKAGEAIKFPVIVTSDETDEEWWKEVARYGWKRLDFPSALDLRVEGESEEANKNWKHGKGTKKSTTRSEPPGGWPPEMYGVLWDRMLVEVALQGLGVGFVGTQGSTMSLVARRRVEHWQKGVTRVVEYVHFVEYRMVIGTDRSVSFRRDLKH